MSVGRDLDAFVAQHVFGFVYHDEHWWGPHPYTLDVEVYASVCLPSYLWKPSLWNDGLPYFSTDIAAAWTIIEHFRDLWTEATKIFDEPQYAPPFNEMDVPFVPPFNGYVFFDSLRMNADRRWPWAMLYLTPEAICKAALITLGVENAEE